MTNTPHPTRQDAEGHTIIKGLLSYADGHELRGQWADELSALKRRANDFLAAPVPPASDDDVVDREALIAKYRAIRSKEAQFIALCIEAWDPVPPAGGALTETARILRGWAKAYRDAPEHRFPSDPHAEFFPVDLENAASLLSSPPAGAAEPVAWRWRPLGSANWIYDPTPKWREANKTEAEIQPLYAAPPVRGGLKANKSILFNILKSYISEETIDEAYQDLKESGILRE